MSRVNLNITGHGPDTLAALAQRVSEYAKSSNGTVSDVYLKSFREQLAREIKYALNPSGFPSEYHAFLNSMDSLDLARLANYQTKLANKPDWLTDRTMEKDYGDKILEICNVFLNSDGPSPIARPIGNDTTTSGDDKSHDPYILYNLTNSLLALVTQLSGSSAKEVASNRQLRSLKKEVIDEMSYALTPNPDLPLEYKDFLLSLDPLGLVKFISYKEKLAQTREPQKYLEATGFYGERIFALCQHYLTEQDTRLMEPASALQENDLDPALPAMPSSSSMPPSTPPTTAQQPLKRGCNPNDTYQLSPSIGFSSHVLEMVSATRTISGSGKLAVGKIPSAKTAKREQQAWLDEFYKWLDAVVPPGPGEIDQIDSQQMRSPNPTTSPTSPSSIVQAEYAAAASKQGGSIRPGVHIRK